MMSIETAIDDSDRLVTGLVMATDRGRTDTGHLLITKEKVKERTEPKKKPQACIDSWLKCPGPFARE